MGKRLLTIFLYILIVVVCLALGSCAVCNQPRFGKLPQGDQLEHIQRSSNYQDGEFRYPIPTPQFSEDVGFVSVVWSSLFDQNERLKPNAPIPVVNTDLRALDRQKDIVVWLGHSSWFVQLGGRRFLIDPVFSDHAAPFSFMNQAFDGTNIYSAEDMPEIDCLLISHDHWDHLDYPTVTALESKVKLVICPLGVGADFEYWGYPKEKIREGDWNGRINLDGDVTVHVLPARHYSVRLLAKNKTLWAGFALVSPDRAIFYSGDSGYGPHFAEIGELFNGFDLALIDCGQYDSRWAYIHMTPEEARQAARDIGARALQPAHVGRFAIANHPWDEPFERLAAACQDRSCQLLTPKIGEPMVLGSGQQRFSRWWSAEAANP